MRVSFGGPKPTLHDRRLLGTICVPKLPLRSRPDLINTCRPVSNLRMTTLGGGAARRHETIERMPCRPATTVAQGDGRFRSGLRHSAHSITAMVAFHNRRGVAEHCDRVLMPVRSARAEQLDSALLCCRGRAAIRSGSMGGSGKPLRPLLPGRWVQFLRGAYPGPKRRRGKCDDLAHLGAHGLARPRLGWSRV